MDLTLDIEAEQKLSRDFSDKVIESFRKTVNPITCGNCYSCCSLDVKCFPDEAKKLAEMIISEEIEIDTRKLENRVKGSKEASDKWCPFLKKGKCSAYKNRPVTCSRMLVISDPENCKDTNNKPVAQVEPKILDKRWHILSATHGKVVLHIALYNLLKKEGFVN